MFLKYENYFWNLTTFINRTALIFAAYSGYKETLQELLKNKSIDINIKSILQIININDVQINNFFFHKILNLNHSWCFMNEVLFTKQQLIMQEKKIIKKL